MLTSLMSSSWQISPQCSIPADASELDPANRRIAEFCNVLSRAYGASAILDGSTMAVRMTIQEVDPVHTFDQAVFQAHRYVKDALKQVSLPAWPFTTA